MLLTSITAQRDKQGATNKTLTVIDTHNELRQDSIQTLAHELDHIRGGKNETLADLAGLVAKLNTDAAIIANQDTISPIKAQLGDGKDAQTTAQNQALLEGNDKAFAENHDGREGEWEYRQARIDQIHYVLNQEMVSKYASEYGLTEQEAKKEMAQSLASVLDHDWANIFLETDPNTGATLGDRNMRFVSFFINEYQGDTSIPVPAIDNGGMDAYHNPTIGLKDLFNSIRDPLVYEYLSLIEQKVDTQTADSNFIRGGQLGASQANTEVSWQKDINSIIASIASLDDYIVESLTSDEVGIYDDKKMQTYYENLLRIQGRHEELGYIQGKSWNETQRLIATSNLLSPIGAGLVGQGTRVISRVEGQLDKVDDVVDAGETATKHVDDSFTRAGDYDLENVYKNQKQQTINSPYYESVVQNIDESRKARESSNFKNYANSDNVLRIEHDSKLTTTVDGNLSVTHGLDYSSKSIFNKYPEKTEIKITNIDEQAEFLSKAVSGLPKEQAKVILEVAKNSNTSVVFGGSRIRGDFQNNSDVDIGFGHINANKSKKIKDKIRDKSADIDGALSLERTHIVPNNETPSISKIESPEEFFQRSGIRADKDEKSGQPYVPSGQLLSIQTVLLSLFHQINNNRG